jgi:hypothetical protein
VLRTAESHSFIFAVNTRGGTRVMGGAGHNQRGRTSGRSHIITEFPQFFPVQKS